MSFLNLDVSSTNSSRQWAKIYFSVRFWLKNRLSAELYPFPHKDGPELIISLTTFSARIRSAYFAIESLFEQELPAHRIILWLSKDEFSDLSKVPASLKRLQRRGLDIRFVERNIKSYKKLVYALEEFPDAIIVTVDDDAFYPPYMLWGLMTAYEKLPNVIHCYRANKVTFSATGELLPYQKWDADLGEKPSMSILPTGVSGVLYPPNCLDRRVFDQDLFQSLAPSGDDIWFKAMSVLARTPCLRITENLDLPRVIGSQRETLHKINNKQGAHAKQLDQVFKEFDFSASTFAD